MDAKEIFEKMDSLEFKNQLWIARRIDEDSPEALSSNAFVAWSCRNMERLCPYPSIEESAKIEDMAKIIDQISDWSLENQVWVVQQIYRQFPGIIATQEYADFISLNCLEIAASVVLKSTTSKSKIIQETCQKHGIPCTEHPSDFFGTPAIATHNLDDKATVSALLPNIKYSLGQSVWFINGRKIICASIASIRFDDQAQQGDKIQYTLLNWTGEHAENTLYPTLTAAYEVMCQEREEFGLHQ